MNEVKSRAIELLEEENARLRERIDACQHAATAAEMRARTAEEALAGARSDALRTLASAVRKVLDKHDVDWLVASFGKALADAAKE